MNKLQSLLLSIMVVATFSSNAQAQTATTLDGLLAKVISGKNADTEVNKKRVEQFRRAKNKQSVLLEGAVKDNRFQESTSDTLNLQISDNDREIAELETQLTDRLGNFGELFGVTRQVAGDTRAQISSSLISTQFPGRDTPLGKIAASKALPTMDQLRTLWATLLQEQTEQGRISKFTTEISNAAGIPEQHDVIRLGAFSVVAEGKYLNYEEETQQLTPLFRQPGKQYTKRLTQLLSAPKGDLVSVAIDPSRGVILGLLVQTPSLIERFKQGGLPGYVVSVLAVIGLAIGFIRLASLSLTSLRVKKQMHSKKVNTNNPLGRIFKTYQENPNVNIATLELKLEDVILKEVPKLDRGLSTIKVLAAVSPLIGLLGTVIGMILTFQAITLWGTGDPKIMAGGISQALVTTVQGLIAAIPLLLLHNMTNGRARLVQQVLEEQSAGLIAKRAERDHE